MYSLKTTLAILIPAVLGFFGVFLIITKSLSYGFTLFLMVPFLMSFLTTLILKDESYFKSYITSCVSIFFLGLVLLLVNFEGLICLTLSVPLALLVAALGSFIAFKFRKGVFLIIVPVFFDLGATLEIRKVDTEITINSPIQKVWETVIAFPKIKEPPKGILRLGIAYPISARIDGEGVGAIRYCTFSTGSFVEPITNWSPPNHLGFDVTENPPTMKELSIYQDVNPPHLHGFVISKRGEFRLEELSTGKTKLSGTTWYTVNMFPQWYWGTLSDYIIRAIHTRVLEHIKMSTET